MLQIGCVLMLVSTQQTEKKEKSGEWVRSSIGAGE
jgi:hypothetical protein